MLRARYPASRRQPPGGPRMCHLNRPGARPRGGSMAINSTHPADLAPPAEPGRFYGPANNGTAGAAAPARLLGPVAGQGTGVTPGWGSTAAVARPPARTP